MKAEYIGFMWVCLLPALSLGCKGHKASHEGIPNEQKNVLSKGLNLQDPAIARNPQQIERAVVSFLCSLEKKTQKTAWEKPLDLFLTDLLASDTAVIRYTVDNIFEKYLYNPNSPIRNKAYYPAILSRLIESNRINEEKKEIFRLRREMLLINNEGDLAKNFVYATKDGKQNTLFATQATHLLVFFHNPECADCKRVKTIMEHSPIISEGIENRRLRILAVYPDADFLAWKASALPKSWINSYNVDQSIYKQRLYDLRAIPSLYLLDENKRVLGKDLLIEEMLTLLKTTIK